MAPPHKEKRQLLMSVARQKKRREKLREVLYEEYKARNAEYSRKYRRKLATAVNSLNNQDKAEYIQLKREQDELRKHKSRRKALGITTPPNPYVVSSSYSRRSSLNRAVNLTKKTLPNSPRKKRAVLRRLNDEFGEEANNSTKEETSFFTCN